MLIYVCDELVNIKDQLINRGYDIVSNNNTPCDVIICDIKNGGLLKLNIQNTIRREGVLIIDSGSKNIDEVEYIINNRAYSSIF